jgi:hypothetical protein
MALPWAGGLVPAVMTFRNVQKHLPQFGTVEAAVIGLAAGQNPSVSNDFRLTASSDRPVTWSWQQVSGPGTLSFRTQNAANPQVSFTQAGTYVVRATAETGGVATPGLPGVTVPVCPAPPYLDGVLTDACWQTAAIISNMTVFKNPLLSKEGAFRSESCP